MISTRNYICDTFTAVVLNLLLKPLEILLLFFQVVLLIQFSGNKVKNWQKILVHGTQVGAPWNTLKETAKQTVFFSFH